MRRFVFPTQTNAGKWEEGQKSGENGKRERRKKKTDKITVQIRKFN